MLKIMYQEDTNAKPVAYRRGLYLYQAVNYMEQQYAEHKHNVAAGDCTGLFVDLLPAEILTRFLHGHTNAPESEFFPGYIIAGITSKYRDFSGEDYKFIELE